MEPFTIAAILSAIAGAGSAYANKKSTTKENNRLQEFQRQRQLQLSSAKRDEQMARFAGQQRADSIADQASRLKEQQQNDFANRISKFDMIEKSKSLKGKQNERIGNQNKVVQQAAADNKLRAGSDVQGRISGAFKGGVESRSGEVLKRAGNISQLMGRLSGTKADMMREGEMVGDMKTQQQALGSKVAGINASAQRAKRLGDMQAIRAGMAPAEKLFTYDPSSKLGSNLGHLSKGLGLVALGGGAAASGLFGAGAQTWAQGLPNITAGTFGLGGSQIGNQTSQFFANNMTGNQGMNAGMMGLMPPTWGG